MPTYTLDPCTPERRTNRWALAVGSILALSGLFGLAQENARLSARNEIAQDASFASAGTHRLRLVCSGNGDTTYILEAGATGFAETWTWVQAELDDASRVCSYDRAGMGLSEKSPSGFEAGKTARELHAALVDAGESGPYVLVGHSLGGFFVRDFAAQFPEETKAIVLVDASHEDQLQSFDANMVNQFRAFPDLLSALSTISYSGLLRFWNPLVSGADGLEGKPLDHAYVFAGDREHLSTSSEELRHWDEITARASAQTLPRSLPVFAVTAGSAVPGSDDFSDRIEPLHQEFVGRFTNGKQKTFEEADHFSILMNKDHADRLADWIIKFVASLPAEQ